MLPQHLYEDLKKLLSQQFDQPVAVLHFQPVGGGSINQTFKLTFSNTYTLFCKINREAAFPQLFLKEKQGLDALGKTGTIKTPHVHACAVLEDYQVLLLEWIENGNTRQPFFKTFGERLAALHHNTAEHFGWELDNYMGSVPQQNNAETSWIMFFKSQRLEPLVQQCLSKQLLTSTDHEHFKMLYERLPQLFDGNEKPAFLHGDMWSGNYMCARDQQPVLIDPAV